MSKTTEEIQALKDNWTKDPIWDIETTPGFEAYADELKAFSTEKQAEWNKAQAERQAALRIQTIRTQIGGWSRGEERDDLTISKLMADGWSIANVSVVTYRDYDGDSEGQIVERVVTLTRVEQPAPAKLTAFKPGDRVTSTIRAFRHDVGTIVDYSTVKYHVHWDGTPDDMTSSIERG